MHIFNNLGLLFNLSQRHKQQLISQLEDSAVVSTTLDLLQWVMGPGTGSPNSMGLGVSKAIKNALKELHTTEKTVENTDQLMVSLAFHWSELFKFCLRGHDLQAFKKWY